MHIRLSILLLVSFLFVSYASAQKIKQKTNLEVFEKLVSNSIRDIIYKPEINRENNFVFNVADKYNDINNISFLKNTIKRVINEENLKFSFIDNNSEVTDTTANIIIFTIEKLKTGYNGFIKNKFLGEKTVKREISFAIQYKIETLTYSKNSGVTISNTASDEIPYDEIEMLESSPYKFTKATIPSVGTLESIFFPLSLIVVSAITVILFFAIRTK